MRHFFSSASFVAAAALATTAVVYAVEPPVVHKYELPGDSYVAGSSRDGKWATFTPSSEGSASKLQIIDVLEGKLVDLPVKKIKFKDGTVIPYVAPYLGYSDCVTNNHEIIGGSYAGDPAYYKDGQWNMIEFPNESKKDEFAGYSGSVRAISDDGKYMIGMAFNTAMNIKPLFWIDGKLVKLNNLPVYNAHGQAVGDENMQFVDMSPDGKYILGGMSLNEPGNGSTYFLYDIANETYEYIGLEAINQGIEEGRYWRQSELAGDCPPVFSPNSKYLAGNAMLVRETGTPYPEDLYVPFVYDIETKEFKLYEENEADHYIGITAVTNDGDLMGYDDVTSPSRTAVFRQNDVWYSLESILSQTYGMSFVQASGYDGLSGVPFNLTPDGRTVLGMYAGARTHTYTVTLQDQSFFEASKGINLMKNYICDPADGSGIARMDHVYVRFENSCAPADGAVVTMTAEGKEPIKSTGFKAYDAENAIWTISFPETKLETGVKYTVNIPAGTFVMKATGMTNEDINVTYTGIDEVAMAPHAIIPSEGSYLRQLSATEKMALVFDRMPRIVDNKFGYLYTEGKEKPETLMLVATGDAVYAYPATEFIMAKDVNYEVVIPAGTISDIAGFCTNEEIRVPYVGIWEYRPKDEIILFENDFNSVSSSVAIFRLLYEGDHNQPIAAMTEYEFDADNTPWNFSIRESSSSTDYCAMSHSMYVGGGKSDDWMVIPQLAIPSDQVTLDFDAQGYYLNKQDRLKVLVWSSEQPFSYLSEEVIKSMREEGTVVFDEVVDPGLSAETLDGEWSHFTVDLADFAGKKVYIAFINENNDQSAVFVDNIVVRNNGQVNVGITSSMYSFGDESVPVSAVVSIVEGDKTEGNALKAELKNEDGEVIDTYEVEDIVVADGKSHSFAFDKKLPVEMGRYNGFTVSVVLKNGENEYMGSYSGRIAGMTHEPVKRVVLEEGTGSWCGNCPRGIVAIEKIEALYPENFIPVSIHNDDQYAYSEYEKGFLGFTGYPTGRVNRRPEFLMPNDIDGNGFIVLSSPTGETDTFYDFVREELETPSVVGIDIVKAENNNGTINVQADIKFALDADHVNYNIFTVLLEDGLKGLQTNYASGNADPFYGDWAILPSHTVAEYVDVARGIAGISFNGETGFVPREVKADDVYTANIELPVPTSVQDIDKCKVVCMIIDANNDNLVVNAARLAVSGGSGVQGVGAEGNNVVFTVVDGTVLANGSADVEVYNVAGQRMANSGLASGIYVVRANGAVAKIAIK